MLLLATAFNYGTYFDESPVRAPKISSNHLVAAYFLCAYRCGLEAVFIFGVPAKPIRLCGERRSIRSDCYIITCDNVTITKCASTQSRPSTKKEQIPFGICSFLLYETVFVICLLQNCADAILQRGGICEVIVMLLLATAFNYEAYFDESPVRAPVTFYPSMYLFYH